MLWKRWTTTALNVSVSALLSQVLACGTSENSPASDAQDMTSEGADAPTSALPSTTGSDDDSVATASTVDSHSGSTRAEGTLVTGNSATQEVATASDNSAASTVVEDDSHAAVDSGIPTADQVSDAGTSAEATSVSNTNEPTSSVSVTEPPAPLDCEALVDEHVCVGYGSSATGGGSATPVVVSSFAEATAALDAYRDAFKDGTQNALVIRYTGTFDFSTIADVCAQHTKDAQIVYVKEVENVTFEGASGSSANFGIKINRAKNVIVRNMTIGLLPGGGDSDAITIEGNGNNGDVEHVWIDHNDLFSSTKDDCDGAGDTEFDGLIDIKKGARYITISYNRLHDHQKTGLLGSSDTDDMERYVTFHHNWYENVVSRTPLHRFGYVHLFNNYYNRILDSGINVRMGGVALIEANYFSNAANPVTSRYSAEVGFWDLRDNHIGENITWTETEDTLANAEDWTSTVTFPSAQLNYDYQPDPADCVKAIVTAGAGATL